MAFSRNSKKIRVFIQQDSMLCGAACLKMICDHYGVAVDMDELEELCSPTPSGVSALSIKVAAEKLGFRFVCCKTSINSLAGLPLPRKKESSISQILKKGKFVLQQVTWKKNGWWKYLLAEVEG